MSTLSFASFSLPVLALACAAMSVLAQDEAPPVKAVVGVYDSRAIAVAFARSPANAAILRELIEQRDAARDAKDEAKVAALEKRGEALQERIHRQGFSTASIADILEHIEADLPRIAQTAGVDVLVSKWDVAYRKPGVDLVDVTDRMVEPFQPDAATRKILADLANREPLSLYGHDWDARRH